MKKLNYVIVFVSDMKRSVEFYRDVLGLPLKFESPGWTEFENEGSTLALHPASGPSLSGGNEARNPAGSCDLGFMVDDLDAIHRLMESKGVKCLEAPKLQDFGGRLARYTDPDGLPFSVGENPQNK